jgi:hypothetical protein
MVKLGADSEDVEVTSADPVGMASSAMVRNREGKYLCI